jgi:hypothetical protein
MPDETPLEDTDFVFKFYPPPEAFIPGGQSTQNWMLFNPSSNDKEDAKKRGTNVRVTVWDPARATVEQAKRIYGQQHEVIAYGLALIDVTIMRQLCKTERLQIIRDPLPEEAGPGHDGHCGFEGLDRPSGAGKKAHKTLLDELAQRCFAVARL